MIVVLLFVLVNGVHLSWMSLLIVPLIIELYIFALGVAFSCLLLMLSHEILDIYGRYFSGCILRHLLLFIQIQMVSRKCNFILICCFLILAQIIQDSRYVLITKDTMIMNRLAIMILLPFLVIAIVVLFAVWYFKAVKDIC